MRCSLRAERSLTAFTYKEEVIPVKRASRLLGVLLATAVAGLVAVPAAQGTIFERFRFVDDLYSFPEAICGIEVQIS